MILKSNLGKACFPKELYLGDEGEFSLLLPVHTHRILWVIRWHSSLLSGTLVLFLFCQVLHGAFYESPPPGRDKKRGKQDGFSKELQRGDIGEIFCASFLMPSPHLVRSLHHFIGAFYRVVSVLVAAFLEGFFEEIYKGN